MERLFRLSENQTTVRTEVLAAVATFLTMAYIIFVQPAVLSGKMFGTDTGLEFGAVTTATCNLAAVATALRAVCNKNASMNPTGHRPVATAICEIAVADSGFLRLWAERERRFRRRFNCSTSKRRNPPT